MTRLPAPVLWRVGLAILLLDGCARGGWDRRVTAESMVNYAIWVDKMVREGTGVGIGEIRQAQVELKYGIMAEGKVHGEEAISDLYLRRIDGLTLKAFLTLAVRERIDRVRKERHHYKDLVDQLAVMHARPGDLESAQALEDSRIRMGRKFAESEAELADAQRRYDEIQEH